MSLGKYHLDNTMKKILQGAVITLVIIGVLLVGLVAVNYKQLGNLVKVVTLVKTQYLNPVSYDTLMEGSIKGIVQSLNDPYSAYLEPATYKQLREQIKGSFGGLGVLVGMKDNQLTVARTYRGTPAYRAGIQPGDVILKIDNKDVSGIDMDTALHLLRGQVGTKLTLTILRANVASPFEVPLTREEITVPTVESTMVKEGIAHITITQFTEKTPEELEDQIAKLKKQDMKSVILDLRGNPGGELTSAVKVAGYFVPAGPVVYIDYRGGNQEEHRSQGNNLGLPLVVLINEHSASAAEILAGAIKDTSAGTILGQKSFGKGVVQMVFELGNGAGLKLTTAKYLTPKKHDINNKGIEPDIVVEQLLEGPDVQLQKAIEVIEQKIGNKAAA